MHSDNRSKMDGNRRARNAQVDSAQEVRSVRKGLNGADAAPGEASWEGAVVGVTASVGAVSCSQEEASSNVARGVARGKIQTR